MQQVKGSFPAAFLFILLLLVFSLPAAEPKLDLRFQHFGTDQGLSETRVEHIFQDRQGFLWIATHSGLDRYDGYSFTNYRHIPGNPNSLRSNEVLVMHDDYLGRLWIGTRTGLDCLDPLSGRISHSSLGDPSGATVIALNEIGKKEIWIGTSDGRIERMETSNDRLLPLPKPLADWLSGLMGKNRAIWEIREDVSGVIWIATSEWRFIGIPNSPSVGGHFRYSPTTGTLTRFSETDDLTSTDEQGAIWIIDSNLTKLERFDPRTGILRSFPPRKEKAGFVSTSMFVDREQRIWIGSNSGIRLFDGKRGQPLELKSFPDAPNEPLRGTIYSGFCEDTAGNIWIGMFGGGLFKFNPHSNHFRQIGAYADPRLSLNDPWVQIIRQDREGSVWIGTRKGGLSRYDPESDTLRHYGGTTDFTTSDYPSCIDAVCEDSQGNLWVGSMGDLYLFDRRRDRLQRFRLTLAKPSLKAPIPRRIFSIMEESPGRLWIGALGDGLFQVDTKQRTIAAVPFNESEPELTRFVTSLLRDHAGCLWISTHNGLYYYSPQDGRSSHFNADSKTVNSLSGNHLTNLLEDHNGNLWIGSDLGLNLMDRRTGTFRVYNEKQGLNGDFIYEMAEDSDGMIWVGTNRGLSRFDPRSETFRNYGASDGLTVGGVYSINRGIDGKLLCGGYQGATIFDPRQVTATNTHVPPIVITALRVGNHSLSMHEVFSQYDQAKEPGRVVMRPADTVLSVEFAALDFTAPEKNRYAFRMEGETSEWNQLGTQRQVTFSGLGMGEHLLHVKGSNNDGVWNEAGIMLQIIVLPHFWQTWWFRLLVLLTLALLAMGLVHLRRRFVALRRMAEPPNLDDICAKHDISKREQEVLRLVIQGKSNRDIENVLFISIPTVKRHLTNLFEKFGVHSRLQLINFLRVRSIDVVSDHHPQDK